MLDVPNFFWDSEPTLHPLYFGVREYLEIKPRIQVLNERCRVFLDLAEILSDSIADNKMSSTYTLELYARNILTVEYRIDLHYHRSDHYFNFRHLLGSLPSFRDIVNARRWLRRAKSRIAVVHSSECVFDGVRSYGALI